MPAGDVPQGALVIPAGARANLGRPNLLTARPFGSITVRSGSERRERRLLLHRVVGRVGPLSFDDGAVSGHIEPEMYVGVEGREARV